MRQGNTEPTGYLQVAAAGLAAGLFASWVTDRWQPGAAPLLSHYQEANGLNSPSAEAPTAAADTISKLVRGGPLLGREKQTAAARVHYALGAALGAVYCVVAETWPRITSGFGAAYGLATDLLFDETLVPALKLSDADWDYASSSRVYGAASLLIFGARLEGARRLLRGSRLGSGGI